LLLATRQLFPIVDVRWRPLDDFILLKCEDDSVYVWQMDTGKIGLLSDEVMCACDEQIGVAEGEHEAGASQAMQMFRALKNKNVDAMRQIATSGQEEKTSTSNEKEAQLPSPMSVQPMNRNADAPHIVFFNVDSLIVGLTLVESDAASQSGQESKSLSTILRGRPSETRTVAPKIVWQTESNLYLDVARLCLSLLHAWTLDADLDAVCLKKLKLLKPAVPLSFGVVSRQGGHLSLLLPNVQPASKSTDGAALSNFDHFANSVRWTLNSSLTTVHLLTIISLANTLMSMRGTCLEAGKKKALIRNASLRSSGSESSDGESQLRQGWSLLAALHCCLLPDLVKPKYAYCCPRIELLARRWQDRCVEVRLASQALLTRELARLGISGRRRLVESWSTFLPTLLDPTLSIFGSRTLVASMNTALPSTGTNPKPPPIPPRTSQISLPDTTLQDVTRMDSESGVQQIRRNQATAIILLGVMGAEFPDEMMKMDVSRATAHSLLELLIAPASQLLPFHSPLRRAAIDLIGRGFTVWQPHLDISKVLLGLLDLAADTEKHSIEGMAVLSPVVDACRTARHALSLIATARPPALITALSKEVARYNSAAQHQTIQHTVTSPLLKSRTEVLRIIELLSEKQYMDVADLIIPVGEILVHCLDTSLLKHRTLSEIFPPITKFYMVAYCANTRRLAFGGRNGTVVLHELRAAKAQTIQAHKGAITSVAFSEDGKYLATYAAEEAKLSFWQTSQTFLGMGQSQLRCVRSQPAPALFPVISPGGSPQPFRARLVWINSKSLTLMLPNGKEHRFTL
uniref:WD_REPEATS_REGION domain-containing protein n=1 Tax=Toxocara canis TaxID=6265 RepID=A0A183UV28_TOXCA